MPRPGYKANSPVTMNRKHCETGPAIPRPLYNGGLDMKAWLLAGMLTALAIPAGAWASEGAPVTPEEQARDREIIRNLNLRQLAYVRQRDAAQANQQQAGGEARAAYETAYDDYVQQRADYLRRRNAYEGSMDLYAEQRRSYEANLADWRHDVAAVAACKSGESSACEP
jgi:hypothetical protein